MFAACQWVPPSQRGRWMVLFNVWWTFGTVAEAMLAWVSLHAWGWRGLVAASALPQGGPHFVRAPQEADGVACLQLLRVVVVVCSTHGQLNAAGI